jgi:hypothetical protein
VDNDGNALIEGALYWNSVSDTMFAWTGSAWGSISSTADIFRFRYTAAGGETSESGPDDNGVTLSYLPGKEQVYLNGVLLVRGEDYTASNGTSIASLAALTAGDILEIITFTAFDLATAISNTLFDAKGDILVATAADTPGKLTVGTNEHRLVAASGETTGLKYVADTTNYAVGAKGDLLAGTAADTVAALAVGANNTVLTVDSSTSTGLKYSADWTSYTPSWIASGTAPSLGNGTLQGTYLQVGKIVYVIISFKAGSTTTFGTGVWSFSLPFFMKTLGAGAMGFPAGGYAEDFAVAGYSLQSGVTGGNTIFTQTTAGADISPTVPFTWATNDFFNIYLTMAVA